jgi:diguanylate cyclase (GGDEF)-like protein
MPPAPIPANDSDRLQALNDYDVLDATFDATFDRFARLACAVTDAPVGFVSFVYGDKQVFRGCNGSPLRSTPRDESFCAYALESDEVLEVPDASLDPRFLDNPQVTKERGVRFYAGAPIITREGFRLGTVCVVDTVPRRLGEGQADMLRDLAASVTTSLDLFKSMREIRALALTDPLTGVGNRTYFFDQLKGATAWARRHKTPLTLIYCDCDGFKMVNNTLGHAAGDQLLREITGAIRANLRASDTLGRLGGDEFALILPETGPVGARVIAERILAACRKLTGRYAHPVSVSLGVTTFLTVPEDLDGMVGDADAAMYEAKRGGRDRVSARVVRSGLSLGLVGGMAGGS